MLSRADFCKLTMLDPEGLKSLVRRGQLPFDARSPERKRDAYTPFEALLTILSDYLANDGGLSLITAAGTVASFADEIVKNWEIIASTCERMHAREQRVEEIICAYAKLPGTMTPPLVLCGTTRAVFGKLAEYPDIVRAITVNVSRAAVALKGRAHQYRIALPAEFWAGSLDYHRRPKGPDPVEAMQKFLASGEFKPDETEG